MLDYIYWVDAATAKAYVNNIVPNGGTRFGPPLQRGVMALEDKSGAMNDGGAVSAYFVTDGQASKPTDELTEWLKAVKTHKIISRGIGVMIDDSEKMDLISYDGFNDKDINGYVTNDPLGLRNKMQQYAEADRVRVKA